MEFLNVRDFAAELGLSERTVRRHIANGMPILPAQEQAIPKERAVAWINSTKQRAHGKPLGVNVLPELEREHAALLAEREKAAARLEEIVAETVAQPAALRELAAERASLDGTVELCDYALREIDRRSAAAARDALANKLPRIDARLAEIDSRMRDLAQPYSEFCETETRKLEAHGFTASRLAREIVDVKRRAPKPGPEYYRLLEEGENLKAERLRITAKLNGHAERGLEPATHARQLK